MKEIARLARRLRTPEHVQSFLRKLPYNRERRGETLRSAREALRWKTVHCLEATFLAAAVLEHHGFPPLALSFESQDGLDHVLFVFRRRGRWGAISRSREEGLHGRAPRFRSIRDLAWSYYDPYVDNSGKLTAYRLVHLDATEANWRRSRNCVWKAERYLIRVRHKPLRSSRKRYQKLLKRYRQKGPLVTGPHWW